MLEFSRRFNYRISVIFLDTVYVFSSFVHILHTKEQKVLWSSFNGVLFSLYKASFSDFSRAHYFYSSCAGYFTVLKVAKYHFFLTEVFFSCTFKELYIVCLEHIHPPFSKSSSLHIHQLFLSILLGDFIFLPSLICVAQILLGVMTALDSRWPKKM